MNIGVAFQRWRELRDLEDFRTDAELATFLLDGFFINVGQSENDIALHFSPRHSFQADTRTIVMNSKLGGKWGAEERDTNFPFSEGQEFEVTITCDANTFVIHLSNGAQIEFPNRSGEGIFKYMSFGGDATIWDISSAVNPDSFKNYDPITFATLLALSLQ